MIGWPMLFWTPALSILTYLIARRKKTRQQREFARTQGLIDRSFRAVNQRARKAFPELRKWRE